MKVISSWSGGKDSCLACYKAMLEGYEVTHLLNFVSKEYKRCCFHGIEGKLMELQSKLIRIPIVQREVSADMEEYEEEFKAAVSAIKLEHDIDGMVFGDIYLDEHKEWVERVCKDLGIQPIEPLWGIPTDKIVDEFVNLGFRAVVVSCKSELMNEKDIGRYLDRDFIRDLQKRDICLCGENGEFHTFVVDGPLFKERIEITESKVVLKKGFWEHWFLDIQRWEVVNK